jgi:hypothetical protein
VHSVSEQRVNKTLRSSHESTWSWPFPVTCHGLPVTFVKLGINTYGGETKHVADIEIGQILEGGGERISENVLYLFSYLFNNKME